MSVVLLRENLSRRGPKILVEPRGRAAQALDHLGITFNGEIKTKAALDPLD
jgi:hypothetical protein